MYSRGKFPMPPTYEGKFEEYQSALNEATQPVLEAWQTRMHGSAVSGLIKQAVDDTLYRFIARDRVLMVANGLRLARVETRFEEYVPPEDRLERLRLEREDLARDLHVTELILEFFPGPSHGFDQAGSHGGIPLGRFLTGLDQPEAYRRFYDLYFQPQHGLPPTLVARYGEVGEDYHSLNPSLAQISVEGDTHAPFRAAYQRAVKFGLMEQQPLQYNIKLLGAESTWL